MISRPFLRSIAFRLPFAIAFICALVISLSAISIFGLSRARDEMAANGLAAYSSLAKAALVSRQVSDLVSSAPFLMNATSPYRVSSKSRALVVQVDTLLATLGTAASGRSAGESAIAGLLATIRLDTLDLAGKADLAQSHKARAASALSEVALGDGIANADLRRRLNALAQSASTSDSLFQLGELRRRFVAETTPPALEAGPPSLPGSKLLPYERVFEAQTDYLLEMFAIRSSVARLNTVARELSEASEAETELVTRDLNDAFRSTTRTLERLLALVAIATLLVMVLAFLSIRSVMRVSRGIVTLSHGMNALAKGQKDIGPPDYRGNESELVQLLDAFRAFRDSVDRVTRLRRTAEAAARTIRSTFRSMNEGIAIFDATGTPVTMNRRVIELVGHKGSARKLPLRRFVAGIPEIDAALLPDGDDTGLLSGTTALRHRSDDGLVTELSLSRQSDGGVILLARDITDMDRREAETAKAQRLDGIMRMTHQVSHEVGNMIGIITGSLGLLERDETFSERQKRHIARIRKAADRGRSLAMSMLSVGSQQPINPGPHDVPGVLRGMIDVLEIAVGSRCSIQLIDSGPLPPAMIDPAPFEQSILNLCLNAAAACPDGGTISLRCRQDDADLVISVTDDGKGMTAEEVDKAFEPYFTTRPGEGGAGLGLAVVYGFMRQSGGDARIFSAPDRGTTVELVFPLAI
ncbi:sensor histidine kinase [Pannonibacter carbonis]|uniref:sensor histidine kinase n=1 Tax=Pannonibacter carbonis TaxID=2067569 RepID=UPI000D107AAF|nr:ATP-binding protein [Pannonibacter carbonis]